MRRQSLWHQPAPHFLWDGASPGSRDAHSAQKEYYLQDQNLQVSALLYFFQCLGTLLSWKKQKFASLELED